MKLKLAVFKGDKQDNSEAKTLVNKLNGLNGSPIATLIEYSDIIFTIINSSTEIRQISTSLKIEDIAEKYYVRDYHGYTHERYAIARYLKNDKCTIYNTDTTNSEAISKLEQTIVFASNGLPVIDSVFFHPKNINKVDLPFGPPFIAKSITGSNGNDNFLVDSRDELRSLVSATASKLIIQRHVKNDGDFRVCIVGGKAILVYKRSSNPKTHLNNVKQGAKRQIVKDEEVAALAEKAAMTLGREICAVDIIRDQDTKKPFLLECNFSGGMSLLGDGVDDEYFRRFAESIGSE